MSILSQLRWALMTVAMLAGGLYWSSLFGLEFANVPGDLIVHFTGAVAAVCLALGTAGVRALQRKGTTFGLPLTLAVFAALAWLVGLLAGLFAQATGGLVPALLLALPGAALGTLLNALALLGFAVQARRARG